MDRIMTIAKTLKNLYGEMKINLRKSVAQAIEIGNLLIEVKTLLNHGQYEIWVERNTEISFSSAKRYVIIARHADKTLKSGDLETAYEIARIEELDIKNQELNESEKRLKVASTTGNQKILTRSDKYRQAHQASTKKANKNHKNQNIEVILRIFIRKLIGKLHRFTQDEQLEFYTRLVTLLNEKIQYLGKNKDRKIA